MRRIVCHILKSKQYGAVIRKNEKTNSAQRRNLVKSYEYLQTLLASSLSFTIKVWY